MLRLAVVALLVSASYGAVLENLERQTETRWLFPVDDNTTVPTPADTVADGRAWNWGRSWRQRPMAKKSVLKPCSCNDDCWEQWTTLPCSEARYGRSRNCPAPSCSHILRANPMARDGVYYLHVMDVRERDVPFPVFCYMSAGGWTMAAKLPTGAKTGSAFKWWLHKKTFNEGFKDIVRLDSPEMEEARVEPYKNRLVHFWRNDVNFTEVKMALIKDGHIVHFIDFDIHSSMAHTDKSWFKPGRILRTSWTDIVNRARYATIEIPSPRKVTDRSFFISSTPTPNCYPDRGEMGWVMNTGSKGWCEWERNVSATFNHGLVWLYSKGNTASTFHNVGTDFEIADSAAFFFK